MSLPEFPNQTNITIENSIGQIISSTAFEMLALSHILNAQGEQMQVAIGSVPGATPMARPPTLLELLILNESLRDVVSTVAMSQMFIMGKLALALNAYSNMPNRRHRRASSFERYSSIVQARRENSLRRREAAEKRRANRARRTRKPYAPRNPK
ncbi:MAG: hypothetical protein FWG10_12290 [Eubacteriaceae bacterium]|nr:hypothetical protein [Eubacteriaceae bacterium]